MNTLHSPLAQKNAAVRNLNQAGCWGTCTPSGHAVALSSQKLLFAASATGWSGNGEHRRLQLLYCESAGYTGYRLVGWARGCSGCTAFRGPSTVATAQQRLFEGGNPDTYGPVTAFFIFFILRNRKGSLLPPALQPVGYIAHGTYRTILLVHL